MRIDARKLDLQDLLKQLKDILSSKRGCEVSIEVSINTVSDAKRVKAFAAMSGCNTDIDKKDNYYIIHVKGISCCT